ncbi:hypothetical protein HY993_03700 [Candidatus Micrarchaeota archaeon]|nr:hypothetical protein [Candidatus Micrarchaeota archaeon]
MVGGKYFWHKNPDLMVQRIGELHAKGHDLSPSGMKEAGKEYRVLYLRANNSLDWDEMLKKAGLNPEKIRRGPKKQKVNYPWRKSTELALKRIEELHASKLVLSAEVAKKARGERSALWKYFSKRKIPWSQALRMAGLDATKVLRSGGWAWQYDIDAIAKRIAHWRSRGQDVHVQAMKTAGGEKTALYSHTRQTLGWKWDRVLRKASLDPKFIRMDSKSVNGRWN